MTSVVATRVVPLGLSTMLADLPFDRTMHPDQISPAKGPAKGSQPGGALPEHLRDEQSRRGSQGSNGGAANSTSQLDVFQDDDAICYDALDCVWLSADLGDDASRIELARSVYGLASEERLTEWGVWRQLGSCFPLRQGSVLQHCAATKIGKRLDEWSHWMLKVLDHGANLLPQGSFLTGAGGDGQMSGQCLEFTWLSTVCEATALVDDFDSLWQPGEHMQKYVRSTVGNVWPPATVRWYDRYSDRALHHLVFGGAGQHLVQKLPSPLCDGSYYGVLLNSMAALDVRPGYAKYGADAYFDKCGNVVKIVRAGATHFPGDRTWEAAKFAFRGSLGVHTFGMGHLMGGYAIADAYLSASDQLPLSHPLRRLLEPFMSRAVANVQTKSTWLFGTKGVLHRAFAFSEDGMDQAWISVQRDVKLETFPRRAARQRVDTLSIPYHQDGMELWAVIRSFVADYLDLSYRDDTKLRLDSDVQAFWTTLNGEIHGGLPPLTLENVTDLATQLIFGVTGEDSHTSAAAAYLSDPAFGATAWVEGEQSARPGNAVKAALLVAVAGLPASSIFDEISHTVQDVNAMSVYRAFSANLARLAKTIDARNASRVLPYTSLHPKATSYYCAS